ncbi:unnamed protein product [Diatraea saccharalis]|uniref:Uncharacterized protein n=1 Tax=Diatraea saccharalis TaxID=40085 RepID=A0A9P0G0G5_9NEOP|nr:unnamed protein product [Diatraea saccharalis]
MARVHVCHEDMLFCKPITRGMVEVVFNVINSHINYNGIQWKNCVIICTDGARAMCGKNRSVVTRILEQSPCALWTHCSLHRKALVSKALPDDFKIVLNTAYNLAYFKSCVKKWVAFIHLFFCIQNAGYPGEYVLTRLVQLRNEVAIYLEGKTEYIEHLINEEFILELTYAADIFSKLDELNLYLQGSNGTDIFAIHDKARAFMKKLLLWKSCIEGRMIVLKL